MKLIFRRVWKKRDWLNHYEIYDSETITLRGRYHLYLDGIWLLHLGPHYFNPLAREDIWNPRAPDFEWAANKVCQFYHQSHEGYNVDEESSLADARARGLVQSED